MEPDDPSGDSDAEMDLFVQQEVEASRSAHPPSGFVGVEIRDAGRDNERFQAKTKRSLAVPLGFEKGMQVRVPGSYDTAREAVEARGRFVFQTLRRVRCADAYLHTHPCRTHTHHTCNPALPCLFSSSPHPHTHSPTTAYVRSFERAAAAETQPQSPPQPPPQQPPVLAPRASTRERPFMSMAPPAPSSASSSSATLPDASSGESDLWPKRARTGVVTIEVAPLLPHL